jgi:PilZ domain
MPSKGLKVVANIAKNRLHITIAGKVSRENLDRLYTEIRFCVADLNPGFGVITDLSDCTIAALSGIPTFRKIQNYLVTKKVGRVVRVIDEKKVVLKQVINFTAKIQGYKAEHFKSLAEAEAALALSERRDALRFLLHQHSVTFNFGGHKGVGLVHDISTSGCAIRTTDELPADLDKVGISLAFERHEQTMLVMEMDAQVIWLKDGMLGVRFVNMDNEQKEQLWERLVAESQCDLP